MYDPAKKYFFLQYTDGAGNKNGTVCVRKQGAYFSSARNAFTPPAPPTTQPLQVQ